MSLANTHAKSNKKRTASMGRYGCTGTGPGLYGGARTFKRERELDDWVREHGLPDSRNMLFKQAHSYYEPIDELTESQWEAYMNEAEGAMNEANSDKVRSAKRQERDRSQTAWKQLKEEAVAAGVPLRDVKMAFDEADLQAMIAMKKANSDKVRSAKRQERDRSQASWKQLKEEAVAAGVPLRDVDMAFDEADLQAMIASAPGHRNRSQAAWKQLKEEAVAAGVPLRDVNMAFDEADLQAMIASAPGHRNVTRALDNVSCPFVRCIAFLI